MFGKRKVRPAEAPPNRPEPPAAPARTLKSGGSGGGSQESGPGFPWQHDTAAVFACNMACGNLGNNIVNAVNVDGRVHAETYVAVAGAIAGFAAQCSMLEATDSAGQMTVMTTQDGRRFLYGDALNSWLLTNDPARAEGCVWNRAAGGAVAAGLDQRQLPSVERMFAHVSEKVGGPMEGYPSVRAEHRPHAPARQLLKIFWPFAMKCFNGEICEISRKAGPAPKRWWGPIAGHIGARPIMDVKDVLPPDIALTILMETAIYCSKIDPQTMTVG